MGRRRDDGSFTGWCLSLCTEGGYGYEAHSGHSSGFANTMLGSFGVNTVVSQLSQWFAMYRELSAPAMQANGHWREQPDAGLVDIFKPREVDVHLCREDSQIIRLAEPTTHNITT